MLRAYVVRVSAMHSVLFIMGSLPSARLCDLPIVSGICLLSVFIYFMFVGFVLFMFLCSLVGAFL